MIKMISINKFDKFETQNDSTDSTEKDEKFDEFSALLAALSFTPNERKTPETPKSEDVEYLQPIDSNDLAVKSSNENAQVETSEFPANFTENVKISDAAQIKLAPQVVPFQPARLRLADNLFPQKPEAGQISGGGDGSENSEAPLETSPLTTGVEIISGKPSSPFQLAESFQKHDFAASDKVKKDNSADFLPKIFKSITKAVPEIKQEKSAKQDDSISAFAVESSDRTETSQIKPLNASVSDSMTRNFGQSEGETKNAKANFGNAENFAAQTFGNILNFPGNTSKVSENALKNRVDGANVFEQISEHLEMEVFIFAAKPEKTNILKLRLRPAELGAVEIKLEKHASGKLSAHFQTENETTRQILVERSEQLRDALQNSGWQVERLDISCNSSFSDGSENRESQSRETGNVKVSSPQATTNGDDSEDDSNQNRLISLRA